MLYTVIFEIFPTKIRGAAMSIAIMSLWFSNAAVTQTFPWLIGKIGEKTFYLYSAMYCIGFVFVWSVIRETKGKTLEEVEKMWKR
ncbi:MFS transporter [candidate division KSB1 bacterium]